MNHHIVIVTLIGAAIVAGVAYKAAPQEAHKAASQKSIVARLDRAQVQTLPPANGLEFTGMLLNYITFCGKSSASYRDKLIPVLGLMSVKYGEETLKDAAQMLMSQELQRGIFGTF